MPNINYWSNKQQRMEHATLHIMLMEKNFKDAIQESIAKSKIYSPDTVLIENSYRWTGMKMRITLLPFQKRTFISRLAAKLLNILSLCVQVTRTRSPKN